jgi:peptide/nickel transport system substrate-binding protein
MLACSGVTVVVERFVYKPRRQGCGDLLKLLWWRGPTLLNPHFASTPMRRANFMSRW